MAKSLAQVQAKIEKLQREADALKAREAVAVIQRIREAIDYYGITAQDLGFGTGRGRKSATQRAAIGRRTTTAKPSLKMVGRKPGRRRTAGVIRYRDEEGRTWTGHGRAPEWFKQALANGKTREDLAVS